MCSSDDRPDVLLPLRTFRGPESGARRSTERASFGSSLVGLRNAEAFLFLSEDIVNIELISSIARSHSDEILQRASERRAMRTPQANRTPVRLQLARAILALGDACYVIGGKLIPRPE
jgi:hypothetical protein